MNRRKTLQTLVFCSFLGAAAIWSASSLAQLPDRTQNPNTANAGIAKSLAQQIGDGSGNAMTPNTSRFIIARDPFRAVRRGRQLFQRKFRRDQGQGPLTGDGDGKTNIETDLIIGAGLADSCAACHGRPKGSAGSGGDVVTRPDSRDAPHLFGLGLKEMLADEITSELRSIRARAISDARRFGHSVTRNLITSSGKGNINYGRITAFPNGAVDTSRVDGVNPDLRVRPLFLHGETISMREFLVGAFNAEMGLEAPDPELRAAAGGARFVTPAGMVLDGRFDTLETPPVLNEFHDSDNDGIANEIPTSLVDFMEFYLLHYFKAGLGEGSPESIPSGSGFPATASSDAIDGLNKFKQIGCAVCHIQNLTINRDRRVADLETRFDPVRGNPINNLFTMASAFFTPIDDGSGHPAIKQPNFGSFVVRNIFTDFKRHDLGPNFHEINYDGTIRTEFLTMALWGVGSTMPFGHDGRSMTLKDVILRHGGEALNSRNNFANASSATRRNIITFLNTLVLFPPDDTASNLPGGASVPGTAGFPQFGHGSIRLVGLFNDPTDPE
ncbi:MAG: di-heme oxidoredictase family protein [Blastocatellia bacterium]